MTISVITRLQTNIILLESSIVFLIISYRVIYRLICLKFVEEGDLERALGNLASKYLKLFEGKKHE